MTEARGLRIVFGCALVLASAGPVAGPAAGATGSDAAVPAPEVAECGADPGPVGRIAVSGCDPAAFAAELERLRAIFRWANCQLAAPALPSQGDAPSTISARADAEPPPFARAPESLRIDEVLAELGASGWREQLRRCVEEIDGPAQQGQP
jgi:hypothetical protein